MFELPSLRGPWQELRDEPQVSEAEFAQLAHLVAGEPVALANPVGSTWDGLRGGEEIPLVEDVLATLSAAPGSPVPDEAVQKAMDLVERLERAAGISPPRPDPGAVEFERQLAQLAAMTPVGRR